MNQKGNVLLVAAIILALIVVGMIVAANQGGVDIVQEAKTIGQQCVEVVYNSGVKEVICQ